MIYAFCLELYQIIQHEHMERMVHIFEITNYCIILITYLLPSSTCPMLGPGVCFACARSCSRTPRSSFNVKYSSDLTPYRTLWFALGFVIFQISF